MTVSHRKRPEHLRTLKEMAEEFEAQRDAEEALRLQLLRVNKKIEKKEEGEEDKLLIKEQSFVTTGEREASRLSGCFNFFHLFLFLLMRIVNANINQVKCRFFESLSYFFD